MEIWAGTWICISQSGSCLVAVDVILNNFVLYSATFAFIGCIVPHRYWTHSVQKAKQ